MGTAAKKIEGTGLGAHLVSEVCGASRRTDLGEESVGPRLDVHICDPGASGE